MTNYDDLAERAEAGQLIPKAGTIRRGSEAALAAQCSLIEANGDGHA